MSDSSSFHCPQCGAEMARTTDGLCPRCLMAQIVQPTQDGASSVTAIPPLTPEELAPHFPQLEIIACLGRGGMGVVYKARQRSLNRLVALKLLAPERADDPQFAARFEKEAQALAALNHPHIVGVYDFGGAGGFYYLLMEFVDGVNLRQLLQTKHLTPKEALGIVPPVCDALQCAHDHGIVHRDIKPENLLIDKAGKVKIADFGVAKMLGARHSDAAGSGDFGESRSQPLGTPDYAAPEQLNGSADHRADIYSLGVVLYEMLTGELPQNKIEPPSKRVQVDMRIDEIVLRALERTPEQRFATATEFRTRVEAVTNGAAPSTPRTNPWPRRIFWLLVLIVIAPVLLFFGLLIPAYQSTRIATEEARRANDARQRAIEKANAADEQATTATQEKRRTGELNTTTPMADGFDFPVGPPDGKGYHVSREAFNNAGLQSEHTGEDWNGDDDSDLGDPVHAVADGLVMFSKDVKLGHGNVIIVQHTYQEADGQQAVCESSYHHLLERLVETGGKVKRGQKIGTLGNNSGMYPSHLHFELRKTPGMGLEQSKFEKSMKNYWRPSQFIRERRPAAKDFSTDGEQWIVEGRIVDDAGKPVPDANIYVSCGAGSLHTTGEGKTGADGRYRVNFGPGFLVAIKDRAGSLQAALVHAGKDGYAEKSLCEAGNLQMAWELTKDQMMGSWQPGPSRTFLPGKPLTVDFLLVPAAQIQGTLIDKSSKPVANREIVMTGDRIGPGGSIYGATRTDSQGRFTFKDVSTQHAWSFSIDDRSGHPNRTPPDRFATPSMHRITLEADGTNLKRIDSPSTTSINGTMNDDDLKKLSWHEFDQTKGKYWRKLADVRRFKEAAELIERMLSLHPELEKANAANLHFHAGQCWAMAGEKGHALNQLKLARHPSGTTLGLRWNDYVYGTEGFLNGDKRELLNAHESLAEGDPINLPNLRVLDRLLANFGKSYAEAYETDAQDHKKLSADCFNRAWELLDKKARTKEDDERMISLSHASLAHWRMREDCTDRNLSIGYWQLSRVYAVLGQGNNAERYGGLCLRASGKEPPFYLGYAHEALARAALLNERLALFDKHLAEAKALAAKVVNADEKKLLDSDLAQLVWKSN